jgi:hypothetical protein
LGKRVAEWLAAQANVALLASVDEAHEPWGPTGFDWRATPAGAGRTSQYLLVDTVHQGDREGLKTMYL